jgi:hypothetical protein
MRRLFAIATMVAVLLALFAPAALAADPVMVTGGVIVSVDGTLDVPADQQLDAVVVIDGTASISGEVETVVVAGGSATLTDATVRTVVVVDGTADLGPGTTVQGDVRTLSGTVTQQPGAVVLGSTDGLEGELAAFAVLMIPLAILFFLGMGLVAIVAALAVAAFAARQTRELESLISREPGRVLVAGIAGTVILPALAILLILTVIGAPIGFVALFLVLPALAFLAWLVAAIWIGDWIIDRMRGDREADRPYLAAVVGVITLAIIGLLPFVTAIATLFGFGALLLAAWRTLRGQPSPSGGAVPVQPMPSAG